MITFTAWMTVAFLVIVTVWYAPLIWRRQVHPAPATYIMASLAFFVASFSHLAVPGEALWDKLVGNVTLYVATLQTTVILGLIAYVYVRDGRWKVEFDRVQKISMFGIAGALVYWYLNQDQSYVAYWMTQGLLVMAYIATIARALQRKIAFDSIGNWGLICLSALFGSVPAVLMGTSYGIGNSIRAVVASGFTALLLLHYDRKAGFARWKAEIEVLLDFYGGAFKKLATRTGTQRV